ANRTFEDPRDFAHCCGLMAKLQTPAAVASSFAVTPAKRFTRESWLHWAIEVQALGDYVSALYFLASFWATSAPDEEAPAESVLQETDAIGTTAHALLRIAGTGPSLQALEIWLECPLSNDQPTDELRRALRTSTLAKVERLDTAIQFLLAAVITLMTSP